MIMTRRFPFSLFTSLSSTRSLLKHSDSVLFFILLFFKEHEINEKESTEEGGLHPNVQIHRKADPKVVCVRKGFPEQTGPLLADLPDLSCAVGRKNLVEKNRIFL